MVDEEIGFIDDAITVNHLNNDIQLLKGDDVIEGDIFFDEDDFELLLLLLLLSI